MKKGLLSLVLLVTISALYAQGPRPGYPCPVDINTNQGGGDCKECTSSTSGQQPNDPTADFSSGTAVVTLNFGSQTLACIPRLLRVQDKEGRVRPVRCGLGNKKQSNNGDFIVEYCLFGDNNDGFFNQPNVTVTLKYECGTDAPVIIACNSQGEEIPLPVTFTSLNVNRKNASSVSINWSTATEKNNRGFNVQRNDGSGWKNVAFVFSKAVSGTSNDELTYEYTDANMEKGISQYRIQQLDNDGRSSFSLIKAIRGEGVAGKNIVFPNPSPNGKINVVFQNASGLQDVLVSDAQGRLVKQFKSVSNNLIIENLRSGFYSIKITNKNSAQSSVEKVLVK